MVAQRDAGGADLLGIAVENAAAQARAERAGGFAFRRQLLNYGISVLLQDLEDHAEILQVFRQHVPGKARLFLVEVYGNDFEIDGCMLLQVEQNIEQCVRVFAAGQTHHDLIAIADHVIVCNCLADQTAQLFVALVLFVLTLAGGMFQHVIVSIALERGILAAIMAASSVKIRCAERDLAARQHLGGFQYLGQRNFEALRQTEQVFDLTLGQRQFQGLGGFL